jgi:hypothetical protein
MGKGEGKGGHGAKALQLPKSEGLKRVSTEPNCYNPPRYPLYQSWFAYMYTTECSDELPRPDIGRKWGAFPHLLPISFT